ncbi:MAG: hypothetical protein LBK82_09925, partial [Planctomycetaceae bacterium]|nr:hypothetical protein [Planctomycetaceae bacterium]
MALSATIGGDPIHFGDDYLSKKQSLPASATIYSEERVLNNTLGSLQIRGFLDASLTVPSAKNFSISLQYKNSSNAWVTDKVLYAGSNVTIPAGTVFKELIAPDDTKRFFRLAFTSDFDASAVTFT